MTQTRRTCPETTRPALICASHSISGALPGADARFPFAERVAALSAAGFDGLVIHYRDHQSQVAAGADPARLRDIVQAAGLEVPAVEFVSDWHNGDDTGSFAEALSVARHYGARHVNVGANLVGAGVAVVALTPAFSRICTMAADEGIGVALEPVAWGGVSDLDAARALVEAGDGVAGLLLDNWHFSVARDLPLADLRAVPAALVAGVQISDAWPMTDPDLPTLLSATTHRSMPGAGALDISGFLAALWPAVIRCGATVEVIAPVAGGRCVMDLARELASTGRAALDRATVVVKELQGW